MNIKSLLIVAICFFFYACNKNNSPNNPTSVTPYSKILIKWPGSPNDSLEYIFAYDASNKLQKMTTNGRKFGSTDVTHDTIVITRDASGYITNVGNPSDPTILRIGYDPASGHYTYRTYGDPLEYRDSIVYEYTGDKITRELNYKFSGSGFWLPNKFDYTYDNSGNINTVVVYDTVVTAHFSVLISKNTYTLDTEVNALPLNNEEIVIFSRALGRQYFQFIGPNNPLTNIFWDSYGNVYNTITHSYSYNADNTLSSATGTEVPSGAPFIVNYYY